MTKNEINLTAGSIWVTPCGTTKEIHHPAGNKVFVKTSQDGVVVSRKYEDRGNIHRWVTQKGARKS